MGGKDAAKSVRLLRADGNSKRAFLPVDRPNCQARLRVARFVRRSRLDTPATLPIGLDIAVIDDHHPSCGSGANLGSSAFVIETFAAPANSRNGIAGPAYGQ